MAPIFLIPLQSRWNHKAKGRPSFENRLCFARDFGVPDGFRTRDLLSHSQCTTLTGSGPFGFS
jgi:hypothetical protein